MKFVMSYSCGKDSTLALHKMIEQGNQPVALLVMVNEEAGRSYFHGADGALLEEFSRAMELPLILCPTKGDIYHLEFEKGLKKAKEMGAETVCFGDIDIEGNRAWGEERCKKVGLSWEYPLWHFDREEAVNQMMAAGYKCIVKAINNQMLPKEILGKEINPQTVAIMKEAGIDVCGENGEYHSIAVDGPTFKRPLRYKTGRILDFGNHSVIEIDAV